MRTADHTPAVERKAHRLSKSRRQLSALQSAVAFDAVKAEVEGQGRAEREAIEIVERRGFLSGVALSPYMKVLLRQN